jgi:hypothetical protein
MELSKPLDEVGVVGLLTWLEFGDSFWSFVRIFFRNPSVGMRRVADRRWLRCESTTMTMPKPYASGSEVNRSCGMTERQKISVLIHF